MNRTMHRPLWATLTLALGLLAGTAYAQTTPNTGTPPRTTNPRTTNPGTTTPGTIPDNPNPGTTNQPGYPTTQPGRMDPGNGSSTDRRRDNMNGTTPGSTGNSRRDRRTRTNNSNSNSGNPSGM